MTVLNNADALHVGSDMAAAAYLGSETVWPSGPLPHIIDVVDGTTSVTLPIPSAALPTSVNWGDGSKTLERTHTYSSPTNGVTIRAVFDWDASGGGGQLTWVADVKQFGFNSQTGKNNQLASGYGAFMRLPVAGLTALPTLDTSNLTTMEVMFVGSSAFNQDIGSWDTSNVTDMYAMFYGASAFNQDLSGWCVGNIPSRPDQFDNNATSWTLPRPGWGTCPRLESIPKLLESAGYELADCHIFVANDKPVAVPIASGTVPIFVAVDGVVKDYATEVKYKTFNNSTIHAIFDWDNTFRYQLLWFSDIIQFGSRSVGGEPVGYTNPTPLASGRIPGQLKMGRFAFSWMTGANPTAIRDLDVSNVTNMQGMFKDSSSFNQNISGWDVSNVTNMSEVFQSASSFNQPIGNWDVSKATTMTAMFYDASSFNQDLSQWCVINAGTNNGDFDNGADAWILPNSRPVWGTCPP